MQTTTSFEKSIMKTRVKIFSFAPLELQIFLQKSTFPSTQFVVDKGQS